MGDFCDPAWKLKVKGVVRSFVTGYALADANKSIELDPKYIKGYYRRASSNLALGKFKLALKDYEFVSTRYHGNRAV